jgi:hypothetical protein
MRLHRFAAVLGLTGLSMTAGACSKSDTTAPAISLSQTEVSTLFTEVGAVFDSMSGLTFSRSGNRSGGPLMSMVPGPNFNAMGSINGSANCPNGGSASASGSAGTTGTTETFDVTATFNNCKTAHYTIGGSFRENGSVNSTTLVGSVTLSGSLSVTAADGRHGNCGINFTVTFTSTSATASGSVCGLNASGTVT